MPPEFLEIIVKWYSEVFGLDSKAIINLGFRNTNWEGHQVCCPIFQIDGLSPQQQDSLRKTFRDVARNPIGRTLLYKLLIEIRRVCGDDGCLPNGSVNAVRNRARSLKIIVNTDGGWFFNDPDANGLNPASLECDFTNPLNTALVVLGTDSQNEDYFETQSMVEEPLLHGHIALFHELLHWYYQLNDPDLYTQELGVEVENAIKGSLWKRYFGVPTACPLLSWGPNFLVDLNDLRVICGDPDDEDCLSENAFRCHEDKQMRFGHGQAVMHELLAQSAVQIARKTAMRCVAKVTGKTKEWTFINKQVGQD